MEDDGTALSEKPIERSRFHGIRMMNEIIIISFFFFFSLVASQIDFFLFACNVIDSDDWLDTIVARAAHMIC